MITVVRSSVNFTIPQLVRVSIFESDLLLPNSSKMPALCVSAILLLGIIVTTFSFSCVTAAAGIVPYDDHCSLFLPQAVPRRRFVSALLGRRQIGYFDGGLEFLQNQTFNYFMFTIKAAQRTDQEEILSISASLAIASSSARFKLQGFWSLSSGQLCLVGTGYYPSSLEKRVLNFDVVLKLRNLKNSGTISTLATGTLETVSSSDDLSSFGPTSLLVFPQLKYEYSLVSGEISDEFSGNAVDEMNNMPLPERLKSSFCSINIYFGLNLQYPTSCIAFKNCLPFGDSLPSALLMNKLGCDEGNKRLRVKLDLQDGEHTVNNLHFDPHKTLIGEGSWDEKKHQLQVVACRFLDIEDSWSNARVGDCTTRLILSFRRVLSMREPSFLVGRIWTKKALNESGYPDQVLFESTEDIMVGGNSVEYRYTEIDKAKRLCGERKNTTSSVEGKNYPSAFYSPDMVYDMTTRSAKGKTGWGFAKPHYVGSMLYKQRSPLSSQPYSLDVTWMRSNPINISYTVGVLLQSKASERLSEVGHSNTAEKISAEGIYDSKTGSLCMVGCRNTGAKNQISLPTSVDCEIFLTFQLPPLHPKRNEGYVTGSIKSMRDISDPLYFESIEVSSAAYNKGQAKLASKRMDLEIIMVVASNTLACIIVVLQLRHVRRCPEVLPFVSLVSLSLLTLGYMIPLILNFEALFSRTHDKDAVLLRGGRWFQGNEVLIRVVTMVAFLLHFRLLQVSWSSRLNDGGRKDLWFAEKLTLLASAPLYAVGVLVTLLVNWLKSGHEELLLTSLLHIWRDLKAYAGLVLDGFLLPQIFLNVFSNSSVNALSRSFYVGISFLRSVPHAYDLYRNYIYARDHESSYIYANPSAELYSTAWDAVIPLSCLLLASIISLQHKFGGRCILPKRCREFDVYEKLPDMSKI